MINAFFIHLIRKIAVVVYKITLRSLESTQKNVYLLSIHEYKRIYERENLN